MRLRFRGLLDQRELRGHPRSGGGFAAVEIVEGCQSRGSERRKILRKRSDFLEQQGLFKLGLKLNLLVAPAFE